MKSMLYRLLRFLLVAPIWLIFRIRWKNRKNEPKRAEGPYLVCANHQTVLDVVFLAAVLKRQQPHFMAKAELFKVPVLGWLCRKLGAFPVARGRGDVGAIKHTIKMLEAGVCVGMFPQGHRYNGVDPRTTSVKTGAAMIALKAGVPVLPVNIKIKDNKHRFACRKEIIIGKPITPEEMNFNPDAPGEYQRVADYLFERVCELGE